MKHKHHIIPKHMGGTDEPSNLVYLSVKDHAEAHRKLYLNHGKIEDYVAWKSLLKQIGKEQIFIQTSSIGGLNNKGKPKSEEHKRKISLANSKKRKSLSEITRKKISKSMQGNKNSNKHSSNKYKDKQSEAMKIAWAKRKLK